MDYLCILTAQKVSACPGNVVQVKSPMPVSFIELYFQAHFGCHYALMLGRSGCKGMITVVDWDTKTSKQANRYL